MSKIELKRVAVLNRGEPAVRFIRALREYNIEHDTALESVAFFTQPDDGAPFVRMADDAVALGPAMIASGDSSPVSAYCHHDSLLDHLKRSKCDAVWPGWGFVSEDPQFVARLEAAGIAFLGPSSDAMEKLGDKINSKQLAESYGVPVAPWHIIGDEGDDALIAHADRIGYPLMVKASAGGGGRGIRKVRRQDELIDAIASARDEVAKIFGTGGLFMEACITEARHIEVQLVAGIDGKATALGVRDCSIQRRNQKVIEEAPSHVAGPDVTNAMCEAAVRLAEGVQYQGAGTAEFLFSLATQAFYFLELNARLQVEHTVTEMVTGVDLVKAQIDIGRGLPWDKPQDPSRGHAIEVRLNAENTEKGFQPAPGLVRVFQPPSGPGLRVDSGVVEGVHIAPEFDSMIAKIIAWGRTRPEAIARLIRALHEFPVVVEDGATNKAFLLELLQSQPFVDGSADTAWLDRAMEADEITGDRHAFEATLTAAIVVHRQHVSTQVQQFLAQAQNGIPQNIDAPEGREVSLRMGGRMLNFLVYSTGRDRYLVGPEGALHDVVFRPLTPHTGTMTLNGERHEVLFSRGSTGIYVEIDGAGHQLEELSGGVVKAPSPAMVVHVSVEEGDTIEVGDRLATLEAMKMEMPLHAQEAGTVKSVLCRANQQVTAGQPLLMLDTEGAGAEVEQEQGLTAPAPSPRPMDRLFDGERAAVSRLDELPEDEANAVVADLTGALVPLMLGYDAPPDLRQRLRILFRDDADFSSLVHPERLIPLARTLEAFADAESLFDRNLLPLADQAAAVSAQLAFFEFCRSHHEGEDAAPPELVNALSRALNWYGVSSLEDDDELRHALWRLSVGNAHGELRHRLCSSIMRVLIDLSAGGARFNGEKQLPDVLERVAQLARPEFPFVSDNARQASYELFQRNRFVHRKQQVEELVQEELARLCELSSESPEAAAHVNTLLTTRHALISILATHADPSLPAAPIAGEILLRRVYQLLGPSAVQNEGDERHLRLVLPVEDNDEATRLLGVFTKSENLATALDGAIDASRDHEGPQAIDLIFTDTIADPAFAEGVNAAVAHLKNNLPQKLRVAISWSDGTDVFRHRTFRNTGSGCLEEVPLLRDIHPESARRIELWRLSEFDVTRLASHEQLYAFRGQAKENPQDERLFVFAEVRDIPGLKAGAEEGEHLLEFEHAYFEALRIIREEQAKRARRRRYHWNRLAFYLRPPFELGAKGLVQIAHRLEAPTRGLGLQKVIIRAKIPDSAQPEQLNETEIVVSNPSRNKLQVDFRKPHPHPIRAMRPEELSIVRARRLGYVYPYETIRMLKGDTEHAAPPHPDMTRGTFVEHDLDPTRPDHLISVEGRPTGENESSVVVGLITNFTQKHPNGMERVLIASDPTRAMGALAEPECRRIIAAMDLATERGLPIEWLPISAGAKISMDSGTENLDWTARVLRRIVEFTQSGGEINAIVAGINVGAQSYWNAEATMLQHTRGVLIMTPQGSMVLTGKKALEYSGSVAAEDERGIGGFERVMGPNGQAQYFAQDLGDAYHILFEHYRFTYRKRDESAVPRHPTTDPTDRSVLDSPYNPADGETYSTVREVLHPEENPERKKPFAIREVMTAVIDTDGGKLERFRSMLDAETAVIWDAHIGGHSVCLIGFESRPLPRRGRIPMDGPDTWTGGTLFPQSSKKVARAINAASGNRPVVVLANLSGFDGSPESLRKLQLEYGAEIGRSVVNFDGPIVFVVVGRYHGGAYVVFSKSLNPNLTALALEGTFASVIGGAPAAAVVFPRDVRNRAGADERIVSARAALKSAPAAQQPRLREELDDLMSEVSLEMQGKVAAEFDAIHTVHRAIEVGSLDSVISPDALRPEIARILEAARQ